MTLSKRLTTLLGEVGLQGPLEEEHTNPVHGSLADFWYQRAESKEECSIEALENYETHSSTAGTVHLVRTIYPEYQLEEMMETERFAQLLGDERLQEFSLDKALFLDIEATHVYHGAACQAFIIGIGFFDPEQGLVVEQILQCDPEHELPGLEHLLHRIESHPFLVTFNGKSYDLTVLENRMVIQRLLSRREAGLKLNPHIDLLHVCRRIWGGCFEDCRLGTLETQVLKMGRTHDLPGLYAPDFYFAYLHNQNARFLEPVLEHNLLDVRNLATLLQKADEVLHLSPLLYEPRIRANVGRWFLSCGLEEGLEALLSCLNAPLDSKVKMSIYRACLRRLKQNHDIPGIESVLTRFRTAFPDEAEPFIELAKLHEHRYRNLNNALYFAYEAENRVQPHESELRRDTLGRIKRLKKRIERNRGKKTGSPKKATG